MMRKFLFCGGQESLVIQTLVNYKILSSFYWDTIVCCVLKRSITICEDQVLILR